MIVVMIGKATEWKSVSSETSETDETDDYSDDSDSGLVLSLTNSS